MKVTRKIIQIDDEKCDGCGNCVPSCAEGAIQIIDGKAKVIADKYCDGLGACLGDCPQGALTLIEREADEFDEEAVEELLKTQAAQAGGETAPEPGGCPSAAVKTFENAGCGCESGPGQLKPFGAPGVNPASALNHWPVQIGLVPAGAPFLKGADLLVAADCVPVAYPSFHQDFLAGKAVMIGCPKFDDKEAYIDKFTAIFKESGIKSITVAVMEVPCCSAMPMIVQTAMERSGKDIPVKKIVISAQGKFWMNWAEDADKAMSRVPFFVRKKVRNRVEAHVKENGRNRVTLADVNALKQKFLSKGGMAGEIKGFSVTTCFGGGQCPSAAIDGSALARDIELLLKKEDLLSFLKSHVKGDLKFHHEFRVTLSDCPNACSRPQISDIGIIGASRPMVTSQACSQCMACVDTCDESAIVFNHDTGGPEIDFSACLLCGQCINACPTGTIEQENAGYRVLLGGRLGRHPRLGMEIPGLHSHDQVIAIVKRCLDFYKTYSRKGTRFSHVLQSLDQII